MENAASEYMEAILEGKELPTLFEYPFDQLKFHGEKPDGGKIVIDEKGNIGISIYNNKWCAKKELAEKKVSITKYESENCKLSNISELPEVVGITIEEQMKKQKYEVTTLDPDGNLRYVGGNSKNYIKFNNELWRIIGVFNGQAKIVQNDIYKTSIAWDDGLLQESNGSNNWATASLKKELNETYFNNIDNVSQNFIDQSHIWNLGAFIGENLQDSLTRNNAYAWERSANVYNGRPETWTGAIGLMYASDYGYATSEENCNTSMMSWKLGTLTNKYCYSVEDNWLANTSASQWILNYRNIDDFTVGTVSTNGHVLFFNANSNRDWIGAKPVLYLKTNTKIIDGDGTVTFPYKLGI